jgi:hypothetical protein
MAENTALKIHFVQIIVHSKLSDVMVIGQKYGHFVWLKVTSLALHNHSQLLYASKTILYPNQGGMLCGEKQN